MAWILNLEKRLHKKSIADCPAGRRISISALSLPPRQKLIGSRANLLPHPGMPRGRIMRSSRIIHVVACHAEGEVGDVIVGGVATPAG